MSGSRALAVTALVLVLASPAGTEGVESPGEAGRADAAPAGPPALADEVSALRDEVGGLWHQVDRLAEGDDPPPWASEELGHLDQRLERVTTLLERLSARVETPVPRLDEPFTLLTVSLCALVLGFVAGRSMKRRSGRQDPRFRL